MHKFQLLLALVLLMQACSPSAPEPTPTVTPSFTPADTPTPSLTPSITPSPTIVRIPTQDPEQTPVIVPIPLFVGSVTLAPFVTVDPAANLPGPGFSTVTVSNPKLYWGGCRFNSLVVTTQVDDLQEVASVVIFTKVRSYMDETKSTPWTSGNVLYNQGDGIFTYRMRGSDLEGHNHYARSRVLFQLVATNWQGEEVGRTRIFTDKIELSPCMCLDPSTGCPPTPVRTKKP